MKNNGKRYSEEQIVRELESGKKLAEICREYGVAEGTVYRWRSKYGGMETAFLQCLRELEAENARLKRIVAQQAFVAAAPRYLPTICPLRSRFLCQATSHLAHEC